jgi:PTS system galactitol-specific IIB component
VSPTESRPLRVVVACGTAIATSTHVSMKIKELLEERGITPHITQCRVPEVPSLASNADAVVATAQVPYDLGIPVLNGIPFLTGVGIEEVIDQLENIYTKLE